MNSPASTNRGPQPESHERLRFGQYVVVGQLGCGGMGRVYEARHDRLSHRVALKVMTPVLAAQSCAAARFLREARAASQIRHENVVRVFDVGIDHGLPFMVMEFLEGEDLAVQLFRHGPLPLTGIVDIFLPVFSGVTMAHRAGIIHRDLKPANVMLARRAPRGVHPVVLDFGISKLTEDDTAATLTRSDALLGTIQYMAPELTKDARLASPESDQYALGVMLYECATGERPFQGTSHYDVMHAIVTEALVPPSKRREGLPPGFDEIVLRAMHRDPNKRYSSVHELGMALLSFGSKRAWTLWEPEFLKSDECESTPWNSAPATVPDHVSQDGGEPSSTRRVGWLRSARGLWWSAVALALYAVVSTGLLVGSSARRLAPESAARAPAESCIAAAASSPEQECPTARADIEIQTMRAPERTPISPALKRTRGARAERAGSPPTLESNASTAAAAPPDVAAPMAVATGTNGALIVD